MTPRSGRRLFLLWAAGLLVQTLVVRVITVFALQQGSGLNAHASHIMLAVAVAGHAWQAWLLFRPGWRFAGWTAMPLLLLIAPKNFQWVQLIGVIAPCVEAGLLAGVRRRAWAWILAGMGQVVFTVLVGAVLHSLALGAQAVVPVSLPQLTLAAHSGLWLLAELAAAAVLAFWMPPVSPATSPHPPPPAR